MVRLSSERGVVQKPFIRYAVEAGWDYIDPDDALRLRRGEASPILWDILIQRVQTLMKGDYTRHCTCTSRRVSENRDSAVFPSNASPFIGRQQYTTDGQSARRPKACAQASRQR
jgi:hypothetical protein